MAASGSLPTRPLGTTGMDITRVGFGAWAVGGGDWAAGWGSQDDQDSIKAMRKAVELGVNWIDTAAVYGLGHSEEVVAKAMEDIPASERPLIFTKCGLRWNDADRRETPKRIGKPESLNEEVETSLRRLRVETIDLYQMHWPAQDDTPIEEYWGALVELKKAGKVRAVGLSNHDVAQLDRAEAVGHVDTLQPPFSAIKRSVAAGELPWCASHRTGVIVYSPMQAGLLTGAFTKERAASLPADDWRSRNAEFSGEGLERNLKLADALQPIADRHNTNRACVALAWTLAWPGVTGAIVGARNASQVEGWIGAATLELTPDDMDEIGRAIETTRAGSGPVRPGTH